MKDFLKCILFATTSLKNLQRKSNQTKQLMEIEYNKENVIKILQFFKKINV